MPCLAWPGSALYRIALHNTALLATHAVPFLAYSTDSTAFSSAVEVLLRSDDTSSCLDYNVVTTSLLSSSN